MSDKYDIKDKSEYLPESVKPLNTQQTKRKLNKVVLGCMIFFLIFFSVNAWFALQYPDSIYLFWLMVVGIFFTFVFYSRHLYKNIDNPKH